MKIFTKKEEPTRGGSSMKRISNLATNELYSWFDNTLIGLGWAFDSWRNDSGPNEIESYLETLTELWKEIEHRNHGN